MRRIGMRVLEIAAAAAVPASRAGAGRGVAGAAAAVARQPAERTSTAAALRSAPARQLTTAAVAAGEAGPGGSSSSPPPRQQRGSSSAASGGSSGGAGKRPRITEHIGFIGAGQMGTALIMGFLKSGVSSAGRICCSCKTFERRDLLEGLGIGSIYGDATEGGAADVASRAKVIFLGVKPQAMSKVLAALAPHVDESHLVISIAAGIRIKTLEQELGGRCRVIRVMPNTPALVQSGASAYALGSTATDADAETVHALLSSVGVAVKVEEKMMDAVTGLSGSGPAFVYLMIEAMADGGVMAGLPRDIALTLAAKTVAGAAQMVFSDDETAVMGMVHPGVLKDRVASPAGTTIAGLAELESRGVRGAVIRAVARAAKRSEELAGN